MVPGWRARVKAMRDNESEKEEVKDVALMSHRKKMIVIPMILIVMKMKMMTKNADDDYDEDEIDIGSHIGLVLEDEEVFGTNY